MKEGGFTLAELLVVLAISGLVATAGGWVFVSIRNSWILNSQALMLTSVAEEARLRAILGNTSVRIRAGGEGITVQEAAAPIRSIPLYQGVTLTASAPSILFSSRGTASPGASWTISYHSRQAVLTIAPTGRVRTQY